MECLMGDARGGPDHSQAVSSDPRRCNRGNERIGGEPHQFGSFGRSLKGVVVG